MKHRKTSRTRLIAAVLVIIVVGVVAARSRQSNKGQVALQTDVVKRGTVVASVSGNGTLQALTTVDVKSNVGGQVVTLNVDEGDYVRAGQLIARIDPSDSRAALDQAQADYSSAQSKVNQAGQTLNMQRLQTVASIESAAQSLEASRQKLAEAEQSATVQPKLTAQAIRQAEGALASALASQKQMTTATVAQKVASANASFNDAQAAYVKTEKALARQRLLLNKGYVSQSALDGAEADFSSAKAQLESARSKADTIHAECEQDLQDAAAKVEQARANLETARANAVNDTLKKQEVASARATLKQSVAALETARASAYQDRIRGEDITQAHAAMRKAAATVKNNQTQLNYTTIRAPRSGVVVKKYVEAGSIVTAGNMSMAGTGSGVSIVEIADVSRMRIEVDVDETDISKISLGQKVDVTVDAFPTELFSAKVIKIAPMATVTANVTTVPVTVELARTDTRLKPTMNATCDFVVDRKNDVLFVLAEAIGDAGNATQVTVLERGRQVARNVVVGLNGNDTCEIVSGLAEGETVVIKAEETTKKSSGGGPGGGPPPF